MSEQKKSEKGQVLVLLVVGIVVLLGFTALAIDGSMIYSQRRYDQSAADAAALAGGGAVTEYLNYNNIDYTNWKLPDKCALFNVENFTRTATKARANTDGVTLIDVTAIPDPPIDQSWVYVKCHDEYGTTTRDRFVEVHVQVVSETKTNFAHLIFGGALKNRVESEVDVKPEAAAGQGYTIVALHPTCETNNVGGINLMGTGKVVIEEGGLFSYACIYNGGNFTAVINSTDGNHCMLEPFSDCYVDKGMGTGSISPMPVYTDEPLEINITAPDCSGYSSTIADPNVKNGDNITISPGLYNQITMTGGTLNLNPGLYCFQGPSSGSNFPGFKLTGGSLIGGGVTFRFVGGNGGFTSTGPSSPTTTCPATNAAHVELYAPVYETGKCDLSSMPTYGCVAATGGAIPGLLMYSDKNTTNPGPFDIGGDTCSVFTGTIYTPSSTVNIGGNAKVSDPAWKVGVQIIADTVKVHGNVAFNSGYNSNMQFMNPGFLKLEK